VLGADFLTVELVEEADPGGEIEQNHQLKWSYHSERNKSMNCE